MNHRVLLLHGIETITGKSEEENWPTRLELLWDHYDIDFKVFSWVWSGLYLNRVWGVLTWLPFYRRKLNQNVLNNLKKIQEWPANITRQESKLSVIAHSYGGTIIQAALEQGWHFHKIILLATTMDEYFDFQKYEDQFEEVHIFWSPADNVLSGSTYGQQGKVGPQRGVTDKVHVYLYEGFKHFHWVRPSSLGDMEFVYRTILSQPIVKLASQMAEKMTTQKF